jgi:hypothetical protein
MPRLFSLILCYWLVACSQHVHAQTDLSQTSKPTIDGWAEKILRAGKSPGGIELVSGCDVPILKALPEESGDADIALARMAQKEKHLSWRKSGAAYTIVIQLTATQSVAAVKLPAMQVKATTLSQATDTLLQEPAVRDRIAEMKITELAENLGFTSLNEHEAHFINLPAGSLRDDLTGIAAAFGAALWRLDQRECGDSRTLRVSWIAK